MGFLILLVLVLVAIKMRKLLLLALLIGVVLALYYSGAITIAQIPPAIF